MNENSLVNNLKTKPTAKGNKKREIMNNHYNKEEDSIFKQEFSGQKMNKSGNTNKHNNNIPIRNNNDSESKKSVLK